MLHPDPVKTLMQPSDPKILMNLSFKWRKQVAQKSPNKAKTTQNVLSVVTEMSLIGPEMASVYE